VIHIQPGAKGRTGAGQDYNAAFAGLGLAQGQGEFLNQRRRKRIALVRAIQGNGFYPVGKL